MGYDEDECWQVNRTCPGPVKRRTGNDPLEGHKISVTVSGVGDLEENDKKNRGLPLSGTKRVCFAK